MNIKSRVKKFLPYLSWLFILLAILTNIYQYRQYQAEQALEKQRQQAQEKLKNSLQQLEKLVQKANQKQVEVSNKNNEAKQCLDKSPTASDECKNLLAQSVKLTYEFKTITQDYTKLLENANRDYCFLYPDETQLITKKDCQQVEKGKER